MTRILEAAHFTLIVLVTIVFTLVFFAFLGNVFSFIITQFLLLNIIEQAILVFVLSSIVYGVLYARLD